MAEQKETQLYSTQKVELIMISKRNLRSIILTVTNEVSARTFYRGYAGYLRKCGWDVTVVASSEGGLENFGVSEGVSAVDIPMKRDPAPIHDFFSMIRTVRLFSKNRPQIVVAATPKSGLISMIAAYLTRVPVRSYQLWGLRLETEKGLKRQILFALEYLTCSLATQVVANSESLAVEARKMGLDRWTNIAVLGSGSSHGVDVERFSANAPFNRLDSQTSSFIEPIKSKFIVGYIGRLHHDKGIDTLVEAIILCHDAGIEVTALIVGPSEDAQIWDHIQQFTGSGLFHAVGWVDDPRPYISEMDVLCLPSKREGFPNVVLEAAAMGVPAIVADTTGTKDSVVNGETGMVCQAGNAIDFSNALASLAQDVQLLTRLGNAARDRATSSFSSKLVWELQERNIRAQIDGSDRT